MQGVIHLNRLINSSLSFLMPLAPDLPDPEPESSIPTQNKTPTPLHKTPLLSWQASLCPRRKLRSLSHSDKAPCSSLYKVKLSEAEEATLSTPPWWVAVPRQPPPGREASSRLRSAEAGLSKVVFLSCASSVCKVERSSFESSVVEAVLFQLSACKLLC